MATQKDRVTEELQNYIKKSQWDKAIQALHRLAELEPNNAVHRLRAGDYYLKLGLTPKAIESYDRAADVFAQSGFIVKALTAYKMVLRLDSVNARAREKMQALHEDAREQATNPRFQVIMAEMPSPEKTAEVSQTAKAVPSAESPAQDPRPTNVIPLWSSLSPEEFSEVVERMTPHRYPAGYPIIKEGDRGDSVYLINQGTVQVITKVGNREILLAELKDSDFFGEVGFLTGRPRTASVISKTDAEVLELRGERLREIIARYPRLRDVLEAFSKARVRHSLSQIKHPGP